MEKLNSCSDSKTKFNTSLIPLSTSKGMLSSFYIDDSFGANVGLPTKEFEIFNQNRRILKRIINPKRDKTIQSSLYVIKKKEKLSNKKPIKSQHQDPVQGVENRMFQKKLFSQHKGRNLKLKKKQKESQYKQKYRLRLQNERMGERIVHARSYFCSHQQSNSPPQTKLNNGVKVFFQNAESHLSKQIKNQSHFVDQYQHLYGNGPTIILITMIKIQKNPPIKEDDLICMQMMIKTAPLNKFCSQGIRYEDLQKTKIKFAVKIRDIGSFVPIKFSKFNGVNLQEIGIVDIDFSGYTKNDELKQNEQNSGQLKEQKNADGKTRYIFSRELITRMRGSKVGTVQGGISLEYKIYSKKYK